MTAPTNPPTDNGTGSSPAGGQQLTDKQAADAGKVLAFAVAVEGDDPAKVNAELSKALDASGPDSFGAVAGHAVSTMATDILAPLLVKADAAGMHRLRTDLMVAAAAAAPDSSSNTDSGSAA